MCVHDTDNRGFCVKNGPHCAFAHGTSDLRAAMYDIRELQAIENGETGLAAELAGNASQQGILNSLDKERSLVNDDPKWLDTTYVLANYKTEPCKKPPRLCRQGYACPQFHNNKDKRRSPKKFKYRLVLFLTKFHFFYSVNSFLSQELQSQRHPRLMEQP